MTDERTTRSVKDVDSNILIKTKQNDSEGLKLIREALISSKNSGSFFNDVVRLVKEKTKGIQKGRR